jgi:RHS repeat-associated protein
LNSNGTVDSSKNTGNIAKQIITIGTSSFTQAYKYDALERLLEAKETFNSATTWQQSFSYDRYGNRLGFVNQVNNQLITNNNLTHPTINQATNRFNPNQGYEYDKAGNIIKDVNPLTEQNRNFTFNAENKQVEVKRLTGEVIGKYFYDGEGKRVKKVVETTGETTIFVYAGGKLIAEYSTVSPPQNRQTRYFGTDLLVTPRVITNQAGEVISRRDYKEFGEEIGTNVGSRTSGEKYGIVEDGVRQGFTNYEKDRETNLDFAEARMYQNRHGRFTAVDPLLASGKSANPQTFNRFVYVGNNPIIRTDPNGEDWIVVVEKVKVKETVKIGKKTKVVEKTVDVRTPHWVPNSEADESIERFKNVYQISVGEKKGSWVALHPISNEFMIFDNETSARNQYGFWSKGLLDPKANEIFKSAGLRLRPIWELLNPDWAKVEITIPLLDTSFGLSMTNPGGRVAPEKGGEVFAEIGQGRDFFGLIDLARNDPSQGFKSLNLLKPTSVFKIQAGYIDGMRFDDFETRRKAVEGTDHEIMFCYGGCLGRSVSSDGQFRTSIIGIGAPGAEVQTATSRRVLPIRQWNVFRGTVFYPVEN